MLPGHVYRLWSWLATIGISYFSSDIHKFLWWQRRQSIYPNFQQSNESWRFLQLFFRLQSWLVPIGILNFFSPQIRHPKSTNDYQKENNIYLNLILNLTSPNFTLFLTKNPTRVEEFYKHLFKCVHIYWYTNIQGDMTYKYYLSGPTSYNAIWEAR